jgi:hypothetical protein
VQRFCWPYPGRSHVPADSVRLPPIVRAHYAAAMGGHAEAPVAAIGHRLLARVDDLATELSDVIRRTEGFYGTGGVVPRDDLRASVRDNLVHILSRLAGQPMPGLEPPRATGRRRAEQGVPLPVILHAYRIAGKFIWAAVLAEASGGAAAATALLDAASDLWFIIDELSGEVTDAYRDTVDERARRDEQARGAMLDVLLRGDLGDGSRLWEYATALRLPREGTFVVVVAQPARPGVEAIPRAEDALRARGVQSAWRVEVDAHVGVVVLTPRVPVEKLCALLGDLTTGPAGLSAPYPGLDLTPAAVRQARLAYAAAAPSGHDLVRYEQASVAVLLASAPEAATAVARNVLGPVLALPAAECDILLATLRAWFAAHGATSLAAERLHVHRNTVRYRLKRLEDLAGRSLSQPVGLAELHLALEATRILRLHGA